MNKEEYKNWTKDELIRLVLSYQLEKKASETLLEQKDRELAEQKELMDRFEFYIKELVSLNPPDKGMFNEISELLTEYNKEK